MKEYTAGVVEASRKNTQINNLFQNPLEMGIMNKREEDENSGDEPSFISHSSSMNDED